MLSRTNFSCDYKYSLAGQIILSHLLLQNSSSSVYRWKASVKHPCSTLATYPELDVDLDIWICFDLNNRHSSAVIERYCPVSFRCLPSWTHLNQMNGLLLGLRRADWHGDEGFKPFVSGVMEQGELKDDSAQGLNLGTLIYITALWFWMYVWGCCLNL